MSIKSFYRSIVFRLVLGAGAGGASLVFQTGCDRVAQTGNYTAEVDEAGFRRGKELLRQGRDQEALGAFLKVIEKRGEEAPESHLEVGLLYQEKIKDPIAAIYYFRRFNELKPNSPQSQLVRGRIDAATREFARTLPAQPMENQMRRNDLLDVVEALKQENAELKNALALARANGRQTAGQPRAAVADLSPATPPGNPTDVATLSPPALQQPALVERSPISPAPFEPAPTLAPPTRPGATLPATTGARLHTVVKGDTLYNLAQRYYGDRSRWRDIFTANRTRMRSENDLQIGMEILIPN